MGLSLFQVVCTVLDYWGSTVQTLIVFSGSSRLLTRFVLHGWFTAAASARTVLCGVSVASSVSGVQCLQGNRRHRVCLCSDCTSAVVGKAKPPWWLLLRGVLRTAHSKKLKLSARFLSRLNIDSKSKSPNFELLSLWRQWWEVSHLMMSLSQKVDVLWSSSARCNRHMERTNQADMFDLFHGDRHLKTSAGHRWLKSALQVHHALATFSCKVPVKAVKTIYIAA